MTETILVIPCSGIGKAFGSISREATYRVVEDLRNGEVDTLCLSLLVMGDDETGRRVKSNMCITVDGCPAECSKKNLELLGVKPVGSFRVVDLLREHKDLKPQSVTFLDENGRQLAKILAEKIALKVDELEHIKGGNTT